MYLKRQQKGLTNGTHLIDKDKTSAIKVRKLQINSCATLITSSLINYKLTDKMVLIQKHPHFHLYSLNNQSKESKAKRIFFLSLMIMILWLGLNYQAWWSNQDWDLPLNAHIPNRITVKQNLLWQQSKNTGDSIWWPHSLMFSHINIMTEISSVAGGIHALKVPYQNEAPGLNLLNHLFLIIVFVLFEAF